MPLVTVTSPMVKSPRAAFTGLKKKMRKGMGFAPVGLLAVVLTFTVPGVGLIIVRGVEPITPAVKVVVKPSGLYPPRVAVNARD